MSLTGQLNDLSLGELIEFFCNQRKTGRLKVDYALAPGVFFVEAGELVDAKVGALNGAEAVYFAMTLPSASFDFSAGVRSSRRTINERWPGVVLEGLRRMDEGLPAASADAFHGDLSPDGAALDLLDCVGEAKAKPAAEDRTPASRVARDLEAAFEQAASPRQHVPSADDAHTDRPARSDQSARRAQVVPPEKTSTAAQAESAAAAAPFAMTVEAATSSGGGRRKAASAAVAAVLVVCAVAAVPLSRRFARQPAPAPAAAETNAPQPDAAPASAPAPADSAATDNANAVTPTPDFAAEEAARRERETREREARERTRRQREEAARRAEEGGTDAAASPAPKPAASGPKSVRVQISYDEAGRVTQAAAVGTSPGAEAYASTAVRVARGRRFPAGKAGTTVVTIPIN